MQVFTKERRRANRTRIRIDAIIVVETPPLVLDCLIHDISLLGARVETASEEAPDEFYLIDVAGPLAYRASVVWRRPRFVGVRFREMMLLSEDRTPTFLRQVSIAHPTRPIEPAARGVYRPGERVRNQDL